ncbi:Glutamate N-acetyltransferase [Dissulfuribacter thermophilus]|uniref:Arginine biosynthesis bifunctional protein ArgJ n=1 Tax=Dissulfuribacter thermophilus TaxID=1156395 RepID=A0A1B9F906_9BACT|nr:bifunctional glutamate N-acetyltransferase/amino-acid acetyltransferase ArgJ [Dissulfuribacter thermophilus]OCC16402.1 Glutamate N-acetyltransferase [Dissulfuribacter thermophilus]
MDTSAIKVKGFRGAATIANIRYQGRPDLGMIVSDVPAVSAACFTKNSVKAAPVKIGIQRFKEKKEVLLKALLVNSGNANACTGELGIKRTNLILDALAKELGVDQDMVLMSSTGVIGEQLPAEKIVNAIPELLENLTEDGLLEVSKAILTTDTREKTKGMRLDLDGTSISLFGMAKGAGMIGPNLGPPHATMLAFIVTDARVRGGLLQELLQDACEKSFNRITVDGDTSTNDTVLVMANGLSGGDVLKDGSDNLFAFKDALDAICMELSRMIVEDGEGATKAVEVVVKGAKSQDDAIKIAQAISNSPLVKTAFFGQDPNWGRVLASAGKTLIPMDESKIKLWIDDHLLVDNGLGLGKEAEERARSAMEKTSFRLILDLGLGKGKASILTTDLSREYVSINADYRS